MLAHVSGLLNGVLVAYMKLPPFIVTLGTWNIVMATNFIYSANETIRDTDVDTQAPLLHLSKRQIVELGQSLGVDYSITLSCYDPTPDGQACGHCDACTLRLKGFADAGAADPAPYASV